MDVRFVLLGSGAVRNNPRRAGPSQILRIWERVLMFDCGRAATWRLGQYGVKVESVDRMFFTHLHFDHICDFPYFAFVGWNNGREEVLKLYGPEGTRQFAERIIRPPFEQDIASRLGHGKEEFGLAPQVTEVIPPGEFLVEDGYRVAAVAMDHADMPTLAFRIDVGAIRVVITGDGRPCGDFVEFCQDADLLVCECSGTADFLRKQPWGSWHITPPEIAGLAAAADVGRVVIKHLVIEDINGDLHAAERMGKQIAHGYQGEVLVGVDGLEVEVT